MSGPRRGLGRGLGALIPAVGADAAPPAAVGGGASPVLPQDRGLATGRITGSAESHDPPGTADGVSRETPGPATVDGAYFAEIPLDSIKPNPRQPRDIFDEEALSELVHSIREVGLLQPVVVRQTVPERYELIMGERRWRASREAGLDRIPAIVRETEDERLLLDALLENLHRAQLNPLEEAAAYDQLLRDFSCTHEELAARIGRSRPHITNTLRLLKLTPSVQSKVAAGVLTAGHARTLVRISDPDKQEWLAKKTIAEGLSVSAVGEVVDLMDGEEDSRARRPRKPRGGKRISPAFADLGARLSDRFDTRVKADLGQRKGKIVVEFASVGDLERILEMMAPGEGKLFHQNLAEERDSAEEAG